ncbi:hypothetical protein ACETAC_09550 [Aceticella autotrophica]|uniref:Uncharacterized protein n=1 Tax=Aceticella autotrophica TaxID=2755338 RepID=A0A975AV95_9THEO|nr:hypothetical protein [Aceticella autotrophica]QSZ27097.1 hypothetical protein ACETAC_09550 [Aceticella autotrophica]
MFKTEKEFYSFCEVVARETRDYSNTIVFKNGGILRQMEPKGNDKSIWHIFTGKCDVNQVYETLLKTYKDENGNPSSPYILKK